MNVDQVQQVVSQYRTYLSLVGDKAQEANFNLPPTRGEALRHMLSMCDQIEEMLDKVEKLPCLTPESEAAWEKANRWLGFMQGVLWAQGSFNLSELREHNIRPVL